MPIVPNRQVGSGTRLAACHRLFSVLLHLVYASFAKELFSDVALSDLVERSKLKNEQQGITAVLLHQQGAFLHGIEGEEARVRALFATVHADPRHRDMQVLVETPVSQRLFTDQPMGFHDADLGKLASLQTSNGDRGLSERVYHGFSWKGCVATQLLRPFWS